MHFVGISYEDTARAAPIEILELNASQKAPHTTNIVLLLSEIRLAGMVSANIKSSYAGEIAGMRRLCVISGF